MLLRSILTISTLILPTIKGNPQAQVPLPSILETVNKYGPSLNNSRANAPHIFNAIHSSMRQWGSSLFHNGMSFFPASIPENTHFYHGTNKPYAVTGMQWLAFEIEHAEMFAQSCVGRPPVQPPVASERYGGTPGHPWDCPPLPGGLDWVETLDEMCSIDDDEDQDIMKGYLHIYRTTRPLTKLLYIDGMSAGKTSMGTLDTQDLVLCNNPNENDRPTSGDFIRGQKLCALGEKWGIEGFVRMEMGFEILLCEFNNSLELESARQRPTGKNQRYEKLKQFEAFRGVSLRYSGITAQRLRLDYSGMVSAFWYNFNLTNPDSERADLPRLPASDKEGLARIQADVKIAVHESRARGDVGNDWQGVIDMIVTRYSDRLQLMAQDDTSGETIFSGVAVLLNLFIDYRTFDVSMAMDKCSTHYLTAAVPQTTSDYMIYEAVLTVMTKICSTLFYIRGLLPKEGEIVDGSSIDESKSALKTLIEYLGWTTWLECRKCAYDEVCFVAVWPWGSTQDHEHPSCMKEDLLSTRHGYWKGNPTEY